MPNIIPEKLNNFMCYLGGTDKLLGVAEGNFPNIQFMTTEVKGAGIAGVIDSPALGHVQSLTVSLKWRNVTTNFTELLEPVSHDIDMWGEAIDFDAGNGVYVSKAIHVFLKAITKTWNMGNLVVVDSQEAETEHEIYYMKYELDGKEQVEVDKYNYIFKVNGTDYLADTRRALGMM